MAATPGMLIGAAAIKSNNAQFNVTILMCSLPPGCSPQVACDRWRPALHLGRRGRAREPRRRLAAGRFIVLGRRAGVRRRPVSPRAEERVNLTQQHVDVHRLGQNAVGDELQLLHMLVCGIARKHDCGRL